MNILSISTDRKIFEEGSAVRARTLLYAKCFDEMHIIVFAKKGLGFKKVQLAENLWVYPTNSRSKFGYMRDAEQIAKELSVDVVTTQDPFETGLVGKRIAKDKNIPLHVQVHTDFLSPWFKRDSLKNRVRSWLAGSVLRSAKGIRTVSSKIKESILERYKLDVEVSVLPIFVDIRRYASSVHTKHPWKQLLFVGRLEKEKRPQFAIDTLAYLRKKGVNARLTIVGAGSLLETLKEKAKALDITDRVDFVGYQHPLPYYRNADVVLVPSAYEGYGMVMVEALASGVPVVATDVGIAKESGAYIAPHNSLGFAKKVEKVLEKGAQVPELVYPYKSETEYVEKWCEDIKKIV